MLFLSFVEQWSTYQPYNFIPSDKFSELHLFHTASQEYLALVILTSPNSSYVEKKPLHKLHTMLSKVYSSYLLLITSFKKGSFLAYRDLKPPPHILYLLSFFSIGYSAFAFPCAVPDSVRGLKKTQHLFYRIYKFSIVSGEDTIKLFTEISGNLSGRVKVNLGIS